MKTSWTLPSTEEAKVFFARYAKPVGILRRGSIFGQLISGITEGVILYGLFYRSFLTLLPEYASVGSIWAALACVLVIEGASRIGLTYSIRAIVRKRWKGRDLVMTLFLLPMTLVFVSVGTLLSVYGADDGIKMVATPPVEQTTSEVDAITRERINTIQQEWEEEKDQVRAEYSPRIEAAQNNTASKLKLINRRLRDLTLKERRENQRYTTRKRALRTKRQETETAGVEEVGALQQAQAREMKSLRTKYKTQIDALRSDQLAAARTIATRNKEEYQEWKSDIAEYSWFLGGVVIAFMLLMIVSITIDEVHKAGAGMLEQVQPSAFHFEDGILISLKNAVGERLESWIRNLILNIERGTPETKEPVRPPLIWEREKNQINSKKSETGSSRKPASVKPKKWEQEAEPLYCTPTTGAGTHEVRAGNEQKTTVSEPSPEAREISYTIREKHRGMNISDLTQRLKDYKKRLGTHRQKAIVQERNNGEISKRTRQAIENNKNWVVYFENLIEVAKASPEQKIPEQ